MGVPPLAGESEATREMTEFRLRTPSAGLLALPWDRPLSQWNVPDVPLRDIAVGPSRHLVKFVEADELLVGRQGHARADRRQGVRRPAHA